MAFAVSLLFDHETADAISDLWIRLAEAGVSSSMLDLGYPPHVTLAVYDKLQPDAAVVSLDRVFENIGRMAVTLTGFSTFGGGSGVCYAALTSSPDLMRLHATVVGAISETCRLHYQAGGWTPHCTLATGMTDADMIGAKDLLERDWRSLIGVFRAATLVEFVPVVDIKRWNLAT
jgi:2'-5' RNA ligase